MAAATAGPSNGSPLSCLLLPYTRALDLRRLGAEIAQSATREIRHRVARVCLLRFRGTLIYPHPIVVHGLVEALHLDPYRIAQMQRAVVTRTFETEVIGETGRELIRPVIKTPIQIPIDSLIEVIIITPLPPRI